jgi:hypothetical protein
VSVSRVYLFSYPYCTDDEHERASRKENNTEGTLWCPVLGRWEGAGIGYQLLPHALDLQVQIGIITDSKLEQI